MGYEILMLPFEVFISYSDLDRQFVSALVEILRRHGIAVWYSRTSIVGAQQWHDEIGAALRRCDWFVVVLSPNAVKSIWVKRELLFALQQNRFESKIVPLIHLPCDVEQLSWTLSACEMVDFAASLHEGCRNLLRVWGIGYQPV